MTESNRLTAPSPPPSAAVRAPIPHPIRRNLSLYPTKPPFIPSDDYHRFAAGNDGNRIVTDHHAEVLIVRSPVLFDTSRCLLITVLMNFRVLIVVIVF